MPITVCVGVRMCLYGGGEGLKSSLSEKYSGGGKSAGTKSKEGRKFIAGERRGHEAECFSPQEQGEIGRPQRGRMLQHRDGWNSTVQASNCSHPTHTKKKPI